MDYSRASEWILRENSFDPMALGKCEAIMSLGNGYMGVRSATEEKYLREKRGLFIAGTFNKFDENEVTELPNGADMTAIEMSIDGEPFDLTSGDLANYTRELNVKTGELKRSAVWTSPAGKKIRYTSYRVVSLKNLHQMAQRVEITPMEEDIVVKVYSGIDGTVTNTGSQHFSEGDKRFYDKRFIQFVQKTTQSGIHFVNTTSHKLTAGGAVLEQDAEVFILRREIFAGYKVSVKAGETFIIEKYSNVYTTRDLDMAGKEVSEIQQISLETCKKMERTGYEKIAEESAAEWERQVWSRAPIVIEGDEKAVMDQFAIRFAQYHMRIMVPAHDNRMNIPAKGLSGEGYKGHCF